MEKILFIRPDAIGDCILAASMLMPLKNAHPDSSISVLCRSMTTQVFDRHPAVDEIVILERDKVQDGIYRNELLDKLRSKKFDLVINSLYSRELVLDEFATGIGAKRLIAFKVLAKRGRWDFLFRYNRGYTDYVEYQCSFGSELKKYEFFLEQLGIAVKSPLGPQIFTDKDDELWAENFCMQPEIRGKKIIILFAGANSFHRTYDHYGKALAAAFVGDCEFCVVALGGPTDFNISQKNLAESGLQGINFVGKTTLRQAAALMKRAFLGFGAETGLAHLACAIGLPNVVLLGGGHFGRFMPYSALTSAVILPMACFKCNWKCKYPEAYCVKKVDPQSFIKPLHAACSFSTNPRVYMQKSVKELESFDLRGEASSGIQLINL